MNNNTLDLLESRIRLLVERITQLHDDNQRIKAKLVLTSKEFDTEKRRLEEQLAQAQAGGQTASAYGSDDEISSRLQFQEQQIQLLETERLNLRDQISFLQNTIQNKEKGWKERFSEQENQQGAHSEQISELQERLQTAEDSVLVLRQEITTQKQQANEAQSSLKQENEALSTQLAAVQAQLEAAERIRVEYEQARTEWEKQEHALLSAANQEKEVTEARLLQEAERLRAESAEQAARHTQQLAELERTAEAKIQQAAAETTALNAQIAALSEQNNTYRTLLLEHAEKISALLERLPASDTSSDTSETELPAITAPEPSAFEETAYFGETPVFAEAPGFEETHIFNEVSDFEEPKVPDVLPDFKHTSDVAMPDFNPADFNKA
nr:hypothetical protein [uncultured Kingella sp.]